MAATLQFFDMEASVTPPNAYQAPVIIGLGTNWQPNDIRFYCNYWMYMYTPNGGVTVNAGNNSVQPPSWNTIAPRALAQNGSDNQFINEGWGSASWLRLTSSSAPTSIVPSTVSFPSMMYQWATAEFTVRGADPASSPTVAGIASMGRSDASVASITVPSAGTMVIWVSAATFTPNPGAAVSAGILAIANSLGVPAGWTPLVATDNSGATFYQYDNNPSCMVIAKTFTTSGSTGAITFPTGPTSNCNFQGVSMFIKAAPDVSITATSPAALSAVATTATLSVSTAVTITTGNATATATATTAFNPLYGIWVSDPLTLPGSPVTGSVVRWNATQPAGTTVTVQTSINNGASWDNATANSPVARLATGDTTTLSVLVRAILTRAIATDPPPRVISLEVQVSIDAGTDELVPIGHGMVDRVTTTSVGGATGAGSATAGTSSSAVASRGGGQSGGGASIKVHVTDLSGAIKRNVWAMPFTVPSGLNYGDAAQSMVLNRLPSQVDFAISSTENITPLLVYGMAQGGDPWQDIQDLATAIGFEAFFDSRGVFVFRPIPDPSVGDPVWVFDEDSNPLVSDASRELSNEQTFNHVIVVGQSTSSANAVTAEAFDNNPSSPTYILGPYGEVTERLTFSLITSQDQAQATANALLFNSLGAADTVTITCVPMPALEPGDIIRVHVSDVNANGNYMINSMQTSLSPADPQQLVCFRQSTS